MTCRRKTVPAACDEDGSNLESDETRPVHHVVPAVPQRDPFDQREPVISHHVSEAPDTFVACSPVELDQDLIVVVAHIAGVSQSVSAPLSISARQPVWTFDVVKEPHLQRRLCARCHVIQDVGQELPVRWRLRAFRASCSRRGVVLLLWTALVINATRSASPAGADKSSTASSTVKRGGTRSAPIV